MVGFLCAKFFEEFTQKRIESELRRCSVKNLIDHYTSIEFGGIE